MKEDIHIKKTLVAEFDNFYPALECDFRLMVQQSIKEIQVEDEEVEELDENGEVVDYYQSKKKKKVTPNKNKFVTPEFLELHVLSINLSSLGLNLSPESGKYGLLTSSIQFPSLPITFLIKEHFLFGQLGEIYKRQYTSKGTLKLPTGVKANLYFDNEEFSVLFLEMENVFINTPIPRFNPTSDGLMQFSTTLVFDDFKLHINDEASYKAYMASYMQDYYPFIKS